MASTMILCSRALDFSASFPPTQRIIIALYRIMPVTTSTFQQQAIAGSDGQRCDLGQAVGTALEYDQQHTCHSFIHSFSIRIHCVFSLSSINWHNQSIRLLAMRSSKSSIMFIQS